MANEYWLSEEDWAALEPLIPRGRRGVKPGNNRQIVSGILHVLKFGCRWRDCPAMYGPHTTVYNRFNRWSKAGIWQGMFERLAQFDKSAVQSIDSTTSKAHRCSAGGKGGAESQAIGRSRGGRSTKIHAVADTLGRLIAFELTPGQKGDVWVAAALLQPLPVATCLLADTAYDADHFRAFLTERGSTPVIRPNPTRKNVPPFDQHRYKSRNVIERAFSHLKSPER